MKENKILAFILSLCLTVGLIPALTSNAEVKKDTKVKVEAKQKIDNGTTTTIDLGEFGTTPLPENALKESKGVKGKIAKATLKAAAYAFRSSGIKSTLNGLRYLGFSASTVNNMVKYSDEIADVLEELSTWSYVIKDTIFEQLTGALGGGTMARDVAWWVACLVDWGVL